MPDLSAFVPKGMSFRAGFATSGTGRLTTLGGGANNTVHAVVTQSDNKIILGGAFSVWASTPASRIVRLNSDGTVDDSFVTATGTAVDLSGTVYSIFIQSDGKILVGGQFTSWNGIAVGNIVRLNSDGSLDSSFTTANGTGSSDIIYAISQQSDGKIIVGGSFTSWNGTTAGRIVRLNSDGSLDSSFTTANGAGATVGTIFCVAIQSDGKIIAGGTFTAWDVTTVGRIVRLDSTGAIDTTFTTANGTGADNTVYCVTVQADGKIIVGGMFTLWNATTVGSIVRLDSGGALDTAFTTNNGTGTTGQIRSIVVQSDAKILVSGDIVTAWDGTTGIGRIIRLNSDGTRDTAFTTANGTGANSGVRTALMSDGKIVVTGFFSTWNGVTFPRFTVLNSSGSEAGLFEVSAPGVVFAIVVGGGGAGGASSTASGGGGGAGGVVWGLVPKSTSVSIGAGGTTATGFASMYSTLYAGGGGTGGTDANSSDGSRGGGGGGEGAKGSSTTAGSQGSSMFTSVGGDGGAAHGALSAINVVAGSGQSASSGGGGGGALAASSALSATGGIGGSGLVGGGGGAAYSTVTASTATTSGAGGDGIYPGGAGATLTAAGEHGASGGGGGGLLAAGKPGKTNTGATGVQGGAGGLGGGGGGGSSDINIGGAGGNGCVLIYW